MNIIERLYIMGWSSQLKITAYPKYNQTVTMVTSRNNSKVIYFGSTAV